jgi:hypothetical protein
MRYSNSMVKKGSKRIGNYKPAKYIYKSDGKHPYEYKNCPTCKELKLIRKDKSFCSLKCSKKGSLNHQWKGDAANYVALHARVYRERGYAYDYPCTLCDDMAKEWAYIHDTPRDDVYNYMPLCRSCHATYDHSLRENCMKGHPLTDDNVYVNKSGGRQCKTCAKSRAKSNRERKLLQYANG